MGDGQVLLQTGIVPTVRSLVGRIEAEPEHLSVVVGSKVRYRFAFDVVESELKLMWDGQDAPRSNVATEQYDKTGRTEHPIPPELLDKLPANPGINDIAPMLGWIVIYDTTTRSGAPPYAIVGRGTETVEINWKYPGKHVVLVRLGYFAEDATKPASQLAETHILFTQNVTTEVETVQRQRLRTAKDRPPPHPFEELDSISRYIQVIEDAERTHPSPPDKRKQYEREMYSKRQYRDALYDMFEQYRDKELLYPIIASYASKNTSEQIELRVCARERWFIEGGASQVEIVLFDWTNPVDNRLRGRYEGKAATRDAAFRAAINEWRENCQYYHPGNIVGEVPGWLFPSKDPPPPPMKFSFDTPGPGFWEHVKEFLDAIGTAFGFILLAVTLVTPIPGDEVIAGLLLTTLFATTGSAVIGIGRRKRNGFGGDMDDAFDVLTIVGNVVSAGQLGWARGAVLASQRFAGAIKEMCLFGQVATDAVQGLLIAKEKMDEFEQLMNDPTLSPKERVDKLLHMVTSLMVTGALYYSSVHGGKRPAHTGERVEAAIDPRTKARLENPREVIHLDEPRKIKEEPVQGKVKTVVQDEPKPAPRPQKLKRAKKPDKHPRRKFDFEEPPPPEKRGIRPEDDFDIGQQALDTDKIILVRDSNAAAVKHVHDPQKGPKPESLKAKSLRDKPPPTVRNAENIGLASAHPDDPRLKDMLAEMKSAKTGKPPMSYEEFVEKLGKDGYRVGGPDRDYVVYTDKTPKGFYSDYDLHGVYDRKTGKDAYSEAYRNELNTRFGKELVQHGPHDNWPKRNKKEAGPNRGPQPPVTAYVPQNGTVRRFHLQSREEMQAFYEAWDIPWNQVYPPW